MLPRVADRIYWMSRQIERAENMARILGVTSNMVLFGTKETREQILLARLLGAEQHHVGGDAEDARHVLGALDLAAHPVNAVGNPGEHLLDPPGVFGSDRKS